MQGAGERSLPNRARSAQASIPRTASNARGIDPHRKEGPRLESSIGSLVTVGHRPSLWGVIMNDPFWRLPVVPGFTVTSTDVTDGQALPPAQMSGIFEVPGGKDLSPQLSPPR
jgi:hypothetical protein